MKTFTYGSVCSGIEAATVAWHPLGWTPAWFSEMADFPSQVLAHHYPAVPNLGDMTQLFTNKIFQDAALDLLVGGTPCQSFSLAGLRGGLDDLRGNLSLVFCRLLLAKRPRWFVWENVPGVFSSFTDDPASKGDPGVRGSGGDAYDITAKADFATLLEAFQECGYSVCWRVLDSRHFGVPQQRRRVFVVGHLGDDWRPPAAVLLEPEGVRGHPAPGGAAAADVAALTARGVGTCGADDNQAQAGHLVPVIGSLTAAMGRSRGAGISPNHLAAATLTTRQQRMNPDDNYIVMSSGQGGASVHVNERSTLTTQADQPIVTGGWPAKVAATLNAAFGDKQGLEDQHINGGASLFVPHFFEQQSLLEENWAEKTVKNNLAATASKSSHAVLDGVHIRRLTPTECERLQGFPDGYTAIPDAPEGKRYEALGNSMTTHVMRWLGRRIAFVDNLIQSPKTTTHAQD
jgi:DNA (cytosine-5)-methyltransferase 1